MDARNDFLFLLRLLRRRACRCGAEEGLHFTESHHGRLHAVHVSLLDEPLRYVLSLSLRHALATRKHSPPRKKKLKGLPRGKIAKKKKKEESVPATFPKFPPQPAPHATRSDMRESVPSLLLFKTLLLAAGEVCSARQERRGCSRQASARVE